MISRSIFKIACDLPQDLYCRVYIGIHHISNSSLPVEHLFSLNNAKCKKPPSYSAEKLIHYWELCHQLKNLTHKCH